MKRIIIGDLHGRYETLKDIYDKENPDSVILLGDYFDNRSGMSPQEQGDNYDKILVLQDNHKNGEFIKLLGNHDYHYLIDGEKYSGWTWDIKVLAQPKLKADFDQRKLQFIYIDKKNQTIYSHAGVSSVWLNNECYLQNNLNEINNLHLSYFEFVGCNMFGDDPRNSPIWVRPNSLLSSMYIGDDGAMWTQIVGHTYCKTPIITNENGNRWNEKDWKDVKFWCIDCMPHYYMRETIDNEGIVINRKIVRV